MSEIDKALDLIFRGHRYRDDQATSVHEHDLVSGYFSTLVAEDVQGAIIEFEYSTDQGERWEAARLIIAYFRWCWRTGKTRVGEADLNELVVAFAKAAFLRIAGADLVSGGEDDGEFLPAWCRPDVAFGMEKPNYPLPKNHDIRDITIAMHVEFLRRDGVEPSPAKESAARRFGVSESVVTKAMTFGNRLGLGKRFDQMTAAALKAEVDDYFMSLEITTR